jgi:hypothetical protein
MSKEVRSSTTTTASEVDRQLAVMLRELGFEKTRSRPPKFTKRLNSDTEIFVFPGVFKHKGHIVIDPIIGVDNLTLRERLLDAHGPLKSANRVCHAPLGLLDSWNKIHVYDGDEISEVVAQVGKSLVKTGIPLMSKFDSLMKVRQLFLDSLENNKRDVVVLFAREKLELLHKL